MTHYHTNAHIVHMEEVIPMANICLAETRAQRHNRRRQMSRSREMQKRKERMMAEWISKSGLDTNREMTELYVNGFLDGKIRRLHKNEK